MKKTQTLSAADYWQSPDAHALNLSPERLLAERLEREHSYFTAVFVVAWGLLITLPNLG